MEDKAIRGVPWTLLAYGLNRIITLATTVVLARILEPEDFGLVALALLVLFLLTIYDAGLGQGLVIRQPLDERDKGTTLTIMLAVSVATAAAIAALSPLIADLMGEPRMADILPVLTLILVVSAHMWFYESVMQRELEFRRRFLARSAQNVVYAPIALTLALLGAGVWSLVVGQVAGTFASAAAFTLLAPYRVKLVFDLKRARAAVASGIGFVVQFGVDFLRQSTDYLVIGRILGATQLGFYYLAFRVSEIPYLGIADPVAKVTFPGFARMRARGEDVSGSFLSVLRLMALVTCPVGVILSATADPFVHVVLTDKWEPMIAPLAVLGIWASLRPLHVTIAWLLNSFEFAHLLASISTIAVISLVPALVLAAELEGITAVAWVILADVVIELAVLAFFAQRRTGVSVARQWAAIRAVALAAPVTWVASSLVVDATDALAAASSLLISVLAGLTVYLAIVSLLDPGAIRRAMKQTRQMLGRASAAATGSP
jgi:lipopolysaccharide exporter